MIAAVISTFSIWFLIWVVYIFKPKWLGRFRSALHILGWANSWSMFVKKDTAALMGTYNILYKDFDQDQVASEWVVMPKVRWRLTSFIFGIGVRRESLMRKFVKNTLKKHIMDVNSIPTPDIFFDFLCEVVLNYNTPSASTFRQIKIEYYSSRKQETIEIVSAILPIA